MNQIYQTDGSEVENSYSRAAGNLGSLLTEGLKDNDIDLNLLIHNKDVEENLKQYDNIYIFSKLI